MFLESRPEIAGQLLSEAPSALCTFFRENLSSHSLSWFSHFSMHGSSHFKHGAAVLARYSLIHRDQMWHLLKWKKRPHSPAAVSANSHYWCELDIANTLQSLAYNCSEFWECNELAESVKGGALFVIDPGAWAQQLFAWLNERSRRSTQLQLALGDFIESAPWRTLCVRLLPLLREEDQLEIATQIFNSAPRQSENTSPGTLLVFSPTHTPYWKTYEELLLASALGCSAAQLLRMLCGDEESSEGEKLEHHIAQILLVSTPQTHWKYRNFLKSQKESQSIPHFFLLLHSFVAFTAVHWAADLGKDVLKGVLLRSGAGQLEEIKKKRKKKKDRKKRRRRNADWLNNSGDEEAPGEVTMWTLDGFDRPLSTLELLDEVMERTQHAYVEWLLGREKRWKE